jgi:hypothetical protein
MLEAPKSPAKPKNATSVATTTDIERPHSKTRGGRRSRFPQWLQ